MVKIKGVQKMSMVDYEPNIVATLFLGGCNMRCPFCQNPSLVTDSEKLPNIDEGEVFDFLEQRKNWLDGVCITGGEPTLHNDLPELIKKIKEKGLKTKLDTNGTNPEMIEALLKQNLLDYIAMDIKGAKEEYHKPSGVKTNMTPIEKSVELIKESGVDYEFRTTVVPGFFSLSDAEAVGKWLSGAKRFNIQQFRGTQELLDEEMRKVKPFSGSELDQMKEILDKHIDDVKIKH